MSSKKIETYRSFCSEETKKLGYDIARALTLARGSAAKKNAATVFALQGELGAGKTTFVQGFLKGLGSKKRATSPTFVLMRRHTLRARRAGGQKKFKNVFHVDAYRLKKPEHMAALELDVILNEPGNIILIEWPEQAKKFLPKNMTWIKFKYGKKENERMVMITRPQK
jgi:tRNA threonylcarbamoyladenosine biosynthesis protein TsaE